jgi:hypothetical protein
LFSGMRVCLGWCVCVFVLLCFVCVCVVVFGCVCVSVCLCVWCMCEWCMCVWVYVCDVCDGADTALKTKKHTSMWDKKGRQKYYQVYLGPWPTVANMESSLKKIYNCFFQLLSSDCQNPFDVEHKFQLCFN